MSMPKLSACVICDTPLTAATDSAEHVLLQALGGRRQVRGFICSDCNSRAGRDWDAVLCKQLAHLSVMHGVERQRSGDLPPVRVAKADGEELTLFPDGLLAPADPTFQVIETDQGKSISIKARSEAEARRMVEQIARKRPTIDVEAVLASMTVTTAPNEDLLHFPIELGGPHAGRSIAKTALAMAQALGIGHQECLSIRPYLRGVDAEARYGLFCERDLVSPRSTEHLIHCVAVTADPARRRAIAYVEYFGVARFVVLLSDSYAGRRRHGVYAIDPGSGLEAQVHVDLDLSDEELSRAISGSSYTPESCRQALEFAIPVLLRRSEERARINTISAAFQRALQQLGIQDGDVLDENKVRDLSLLIAQELAPYVLAMLRQHRPEQNEEGDPAREP